MQELMFSVLVVTYNQEKYIAQTLDSILNQVHNYKYEIVVGEDCSIDNTKKIIEEYVEKYPDIIKPIYNNPNRGLINNYFNVIAHCKGKYIMQCAGDDYWLPGKVTRQIEFMECNLDIGLCYGKSKVWKESAQLYECNDLGLDGESFNKMLLDGNKIPALTVCMRSELIKSYIEEVKPLEKKWLMEDLPMWLWFYKNSKVKFDEECMAVYRIIENSVSHSNDEQKELDFRKSIYDVREFYAKKYNIKLECWDEFKDFFYILYRKNIKNYSNETFIEMKKVYKQIVKKTKKEKIILFFSMNEYLFIIFRFLVKLSRKKNDNR